MKSLQLLALGATLSFAALSPLTAQAQSHMAGGMNDMKAAPASKADMTEGVVRKLDKATGEVTLKHGEIKNLQMPGMTMVFKAAQPSLLNGLAVGDKVRFTAENQQGALTVTAIEKAQ